MVSSFLSQVQPERVPVCDRADSGSPILPLHRFQPISINTKWSFVNRSVKRFERDELYRLHRFSISIHNRTKSSQARLTNRSALSPARSRLPEPRLTHDIRHYQASHTAQRALPCRFDAEYRVIRYRECARYHDMLDTMNAHQKSCFARGTGPSTETFVELTL